MSGRIVVVDYHKGNLLSVVRSLVEVGGDAIVSDDPDVIDSADAIVLPGVGAFEDAMAYMEESGQVDSIIAAVGSWRPFLGICLGEHLIAEWGNESSDGRWVEGMNLIRGSATRLDGSVLKVPHVGWDQIHFTDLGRECPLFAGVAEGANVYFTHSYALDDDVDEDIVAARTDYTRNFPAAIWDDNIFAVQFHPEKSSATGLRILRNFVELVDETTRRRYC